MKKRLNMEDHPSIYGASWELNVHKLMRQKKALERGVKNMKAKNMTLHNKIDVLEEGILELHQDKGGLT